MLVRDNVLHGGGGDEARNDSPLFHFNMLFRPPTALHLTPPHQLPTAGGMATQLPQPLTLALKAAFLIVSWHNASGFVHQLQRPSATARTRPHELRMAAAAAAVPKAKEVQYNTGAAGQAAPVD